MISILLIGCGRIAEKHLRAIQKLDCFQLYGIVDPHPERASALIQKIYGKNQKDSILLFRNREDLEKTNPRFPVSLALALASPSGSHAEWVRWALEHNFPVLCEKPLALSYEEAAALASEAEARKLPLALCHIYRFFPLVEELRRAFREKVWGELLYAHAEVWWGHEEAYFQGKKGLWTYEGGALLNQSIHALDLLCYLSDLQPDSWTCIMRQSVHKNCQNEDLAVMQGHCHKASTLFQLVGSTATNPQSHEAILSFHFTQGSLSLRLKKKRIRLQVQGGYSKSKLFMLFLQELKKEARKLNCSRFHCLKNKLHPHQGIYADFYQACTSGQTPRASGRAGAQAVGHILAAYASSYQEGKPIGIRDLPPAWSTSSMEKGGNFFDPDQ